MEDIENATITVQSQGRNLYLYTIKMGQITIYLEKEEWLVPETGQAFNTYARLHGVTGLSIVPGTLDVDPADIPRVEGPAGD